MIINKTTFLNSTLILNTTVSLRNSDKTATKSNKYRYTYKDVKSQCVSRVSFINKSILIQIYKGMSA